MYFLCQTVSLSDHLSVKERIYVCANYYEDNYIPCEMIVLLLAHI